MLEDICPRYMGVSTTETVVFSVTNLPFSNSTVMDEGISCVSVQVHPQKPGENYYIGIYFFKVFLYAKLLNS